MCSDILCYFGFIKRKRGAVIYTPTISKMELVTAVITLILMGRDRARRSVVRAHSSLPVEDGETIIDACNLTLPQFEQIIISTGTLGPPIVTLVDPTGCRSRRDDKLVSSGTIQLL